MSCLPIQSYKCIPSTHCKVKLKSKESYDREETIIQTKNTKIHVSISEKYSNFKNKLM